MSRTRIKLCGLRRPEDIAAANALRPDYIGFVFAPGSRRAVSAGQAAQLRAALAPGILAVGVFVNEPPEAVAALVRGGVIDLPQLHGQEDEAYLRALRALLPPDVPVIQAVRMEGEASAAAAQRSGADYLLLDSGRGGTGTAFPWELAARVARPYFLAGGLDPGNVAAAIDALHPYAVDVSSGIETDGWKDTTKMRAFVRAVREREAQV